MSLNKETKLYIYIYIYILLIIIEIERVTNTFTIQN